MAAEHLWPGDGAGRPGEQGRPFPQALGGGPADFRRPGPGRAVPPPRTGGLRLWWLGDGPAADPGSDDPRAAGQAEGLSSSCAEIMRSDSARTLLRIEIKVCVLRAPPFCGLSWVDYLRIIYVVAFSFPVDVPFSSAFSFGTGRAREDTSVRTKRTN